MSIIIYILIMLFYIYQPLKKVEPKLYYLFGSTFSKGGFIILR